MDRACETYNGDLPAHNACWKHISGSRIGPDYRTENLRQVALKAQELLVSKEAEFNERIRNNDRLPISLGHALAAANVVCSATAQRLSQLAPNFTFVVDECTSITHLYPDQQLSPLLRVMECLSMYNIWFVLVSTSCKITSSVPSMEVKSTQRFPNQMSLPAWFFLPFDTLLQGRKPLDTIGDSIMLAELQYFGRPVGGLYPLCILH